MKKRIIFICKFNRFRSQIAAGFFEKLKMNNKYVVASAGVIRGQPISKVVKEIASRYKLKLSKPKGLVREILNKQDVIVIVADDVPLAIFKNLKKSGKIVKVWKVHDAKETSVSKIKPSVHAIEEKVKKLVKELE
jgi:protein-tyrosine-phosphatase